MKKKTIKLNNFLKLLGFIKCYMCGKIKHKSKYLEISMTEDGETSFKCYVCKICSLSLLGD